MFGLLSKVLSIAVSVVSESVAFLSSARGVGYHSVFNYEYIIADGWERTWPTSAVQEPVMIESAMTPYSLPLVNTRVDDHLREDAHMCSHV